MANRHLEVVPHGSQFMGRVGEIEDRRGRQGRNSVTVDFGIAVGAMLAGSNDLLFDFPLGRRLKPEALKLFGIAIGRAPCHATYHYFSRGLDGDALARALGRFARGADAPEHIGIVLRLRSG